MAMTKKPRVLPFPTKPKPSIFDQPGGLELTVRHPWKDDTVTTIPASPPKKPPE